MTFKHTTSDVSIANRALGMVSESRMLSSTDEEGLQGEAVRRWYKPIVARLLEMHHWGLATKRATPTTVTNGRSTEWLYAYAAPDDMAFPVGFTLGSGASTVSYYRGLAGLIGMIYGKPIFQYHGNTIYSNIGGELEYVSFDITEADFTQAFTNIVVLMLASRLALELPKDADLSADLEEKAQSEINVAITQNLNIGRPQYGMIASEVELVRGTGFGHNWDFISRGPGG